MTIEVDQSIKIEQTNGDTVIAFSNHTSKSLIISASDKKELQTIFRKAGKRRVFVYRVFAILVFLLIKDHLETIDMMIIDREYFGWEPQIKDYLLQEIRKVKHSFRAKQIQFRLIGKGSRAHALAYQVARRHKKPDMTVSWAQVARSFV